jgi:hypothetical protein
MIYLVNYYYLIISMIIIVNFMAMYSQIREITEIFIGLLLLFHLINHQILLLQIYHIIKSSVMLLIIHFLFN